MDLKKNKSAQLGHKRGLYFNIGLVVAMAFVVSAFEWKSYGDLNKVDCKLLGLVEDDWIVPPTVHEEFKRPKPKVIKEIIPVEDESLEENLEDIIIDMDEIGEIEPEEIEGLPEEETDVVHHFVEKMPEFEGGVQAFYNYIGKNMKYPNQARRMGIEGKVFVEFIVDTEGNLIQVRSIKGIGAGCDEEAVRVIQGAPSWKPGKQRGVPVKVKMVLPITFKLQ